MNKDTYKIILIGNSGVGKSSLNYWFMHEKPIPVSCPTIGAAFFIKSITHNDKKIKLNIWDTAGQERFRSLVKMYYKDTASCICVFDVTNKESFNSLQYWINDYRQNNKNDSSRIIIIGNKCDIDKSLWTVTENEVAKFAEDNKCKHIFTSSVTGENVTKIFISIVDDILNPVKESNMNENENENVAVINDYNNNYNRIIDLNYLTKKIDISGCNCQN